MTELEKLHQWRIGRFQADDESECALCGCQSDEPGADGPCNGLQYPRGYGPGDAMSAYCSPQEIPAALRAHQQGEGR